MKYQVKCPERNCASSLEEIEADKVRTDRSNNLVFVKDGEQVGMYHKDRWIRWWLIED